MLKHTLRSLRLRSLSLFHSFPVQDIDFIPAEQAGIVAEIYAGSTSLKDKTGPSILDPMRCWKTLHAYRRPTSILPDAQAISSSWRKDLVLNLSGFVSENFLPNVAARSRIQLFRQRGDFSGRRIFHQRLGEKESSAAFAFVGFDAKSI